MKQESLVVSKTNRRRYGSYMGEISPMPEIRGLAWSSLPQPRVALKSYRSENSVHFGVDSRFTTFSEP